MKYISVGQDDSDVEQNVRSPPRSNPTKYYVKMALVFALPWMILLGVVLNQTTTTAVCTESRVQKLNTIRNVYWDSSTIARNERYATLEQKGATIWFTGLSGSGKSTIARQIERELIGKRKHVYRLDGDNVRIGLNRDLGFSAVDRKESVRRVGELAALFSDSGTITLVSLVSPYRSDRDEVRALHQKMGLPFIEVFVDVPLDVVTKRDTKGLYQKALRGDIKDFTGISAPYEPPSQPDIYLNTDRMTLDTEVATLMQFLTQKGYLHGIETHDTGYPGIALADGGNAVVNFTTRYAPVPEPASDLPQVLLRDEDLHWVQVLGEGWASPLRGFMKESTYLESLHFNSILFDSDHMCGLDIDQPTNFSDYQSNVGTCDRVSMSVPIVLPINDATKALIGEKQDKVLLIAPSGQAVAWMENLEVFPHRKEERIARTFGAMDREHPYIAEILRSGEYLLGGTVHLLDRVRYNDGLDRFRLSPAELREKFTEMKADAVFAFQTRNPTHAGHAYLMNAAREELLRRGFKNPVLWLSPLGGWTKSDDVPLDVRIKQHEAILKNGMLNASSTVLSIWPSPMIYAGPREVLWHAKSRKNAGASFFVVGRDPAGIKHSNHSKGDLYAGDHGRFVLHLAPGMEDMSLISFTKVYYDVQDHQMKPMDSTRKQDFLSISGSRMRQMARDGLKPCKEGADLRPEEWEHQPSCVPDGFMVDAGWKIVVDYYQNQHNKTWLPYARQFVHPAVDSTGESIGTYGQTDFKYYFTNATGAKISPWHDIPLFSEDEQALNFIVEIPKGILAKMEVNKESRLNPIMQDTISSTSQPRFYKYGVPFFNYGLFPQTWEDPSENGDNDPLDVIELGETTFDMGSIHRVKVLGSLELIDQGEVDHKILVLALSDPLAPLVETLDDLEKHRPGVVKRLIDWLKRYKIPEGKALNRLSQEEPTSKETALEIIQDTHSKWQALVDKTSHADFWLH